MAASGIRVFPAERKIAEEYYRECLGREAVADDLHVALCLGNDLRSSTKPDGERMADELYAKSQQKTKHGCAHKSLGP